MPTPNQVACAACECYPSKLILGLCPECRMKVVRPPAKYQWTADMDDQLRQVYRRTGRKKLVLSAELTKFCSAFRLPRTAVMNRARRLGLNIVRPFKPWTHEEKEGLRKLTGLLGVNTIAKRLGRSPYAIKNQLSQMNLTAQLTDGYTIRQLQLLLGVPNRNIQMWLTTRALHMDLDKERITEASVREFVRHNLFEFSFKRVDESWMKSLLSTQRAERRRADELKAA